MLVNVAMLFRVTNESITESNDISRVFSLFRKLAVQEITSSDETGDPSYGVATGAVEATSGVAHLGSIDAVGTFLSSFNHFF